MNLKWFGASSTEFDPNSVNIFSMNKNISTVNTPKAYLAILILAGFENDALNDIPGIV